MTEELETYELEELAEQPGIYFNPKTEVVIAVDDSASVDQEAFDPARLGDADWIRISEEVPIDEQARDEALEEFQAEFHAGGGGSLSATARDQAEDIEDGTDAPEADRDPEGDEDDAPDDGGEEGGTED
ncbi:MAG: hypothetical protein ACO3CR_04730 [Solirubrobacterales bacterium]